MSKKKQIKQENEVLEQTSADNQNPEVKQECEPEEPKKEPDRKEEESIYLRDTLLGMKEIQQFGLNRYFLYAILKDKFYTLAEAKRLIKEAMR